MLILFSKSKKKPVYQIINSLIGYDKQNIKLLIFLIENGKYLLKYENKTKAQKSSF